MMDDATLAEVLICWLEVWLAKKRKPRAVRLDFSFGPLTKKRITMYKLPGDRQVTASIAPVDAAGNPASIDGAPVWNSADPTLFSVTAAADGLSAVIVPLGAAGTAQLSVSADADLGAGVITITGTLDIEVVGGQAVAINIVPGTVEPKP